MSGNVSGAEATGPLPPPGPPRPPAGPPSLASWIRFERNGIAVTLIPLLTGDAPRSQAGLERTARAQAKTGACTGCTPASGFTVSAVLAAAAPVPSPGQAAAGQAAQAHRHRGLLAG
jgi:hypothetical protein